MAALARRGVGNGDGSNRLMPKRATPRGGRRRRFGFRAQRQLRIPFVVRYGDGDADLTGMANPIAGVQSDRVAPSIEIVPETPRFQMHRERKSSAPAQHNSAGRLQALVFIADGEGSGRGI